MKKLLKYLTAFTTIIALSAMFMAATHKTETDTKGENPLMCWITINVNLLGDCVYVNDSSEYVVNLSIYNVCDNPATPLYNETQYASSEDGNFFSFCIQDTLCLNDETASCFKIVTTAYKKNIVNDEIVCEGQSSQPTTNCEGLMDYDNQIISVILN